MSEVIEEYIRRNSGMQESVAFEAFLQQDRIKAWVGTDESRKDHGCHNVLILYPVDTESSHSQKCHS